jgi:tRNA G10  N-methylase Trm11
MTAPKTKLVWENFPAAFNDDILSAIDSLLKPGWKVLDPFAGTGRIHELRPRVQTYGIEIEPEGAAMSRYTRVGDATKLPKKWTGFFDAIATSCSYGNRMADSHNAQEKCKACSGSGYVRVFEEHERPVLPCEKCGGKGKRKYKRITYTHTLGRPLHPNNSGGMQWGNAYRELHVEAWTEAHRVLRKGGLLIVNVKNHIRTIKGVQQEVDVVGWHVDTILDLGFKEVDRIPVKTSGMGFGQNRDARAECEWVLVFRKPGRP